MYEKVCERECVRECVYERESVCVDAPVSPDSIGLTPEWRMCGCVCGVCEWVGSGRGRGGEISERGRERRWVMIYINVS